MTNNLNETTKTPTTRNVLRIDGHYYVQGLSDGRGRILMYHYTSDESETPDIDSPTDGRKMFGALYDLMQCEDGIVDGDTFVTPHGVFLVVSTWELRVVDETKNEAKARRAKIRRMEKV